MDFVKLRESQLSIIIYCVICLAASALLLGFSIYTMKDRIDSLERKVSILENSVYFMHGIGENDEQI